VSALRACSANITCVRVINLRAVRGGGIGRTIDDRHVFLILEAALLSQLDIRGNTTFVRASADRRALQKAHHRRAYARIRRSARSAGSRH